MTGLYEIVKPILPTKMTAAVIGAGGAAGFLKAGPLGGIVGGFLGYQVKTTLQNVKDGMTHYIGNGCGTISYGMREMASTASTKVCNCIHYIATGMSYWIINQVENTGWVKATHVSADAAYIAKCQTARCDGRSMNLQALFTPVANGVSNKTQVINALVAHATATNQSVSPEQIQQWVALGERLVQALSNSEGSTVPNGAVIVNGPEGEIYAESSVYTTRAIMWYFTAQALWGELEKNKVVLCGHAKSTPAEMQAMVNDFLTHQTFVFPDAQGSVFTFLSQASAAYLDNTALLSQDSGLQGADQAVRQQSATMKLHAIDDSSRQLPGCARRTAINLLASVDGQKRLAVRLEEYGNPALYGQRGEGHEPALWRVAQAVAAVPNKIIAALGDFAPVDMTAVKTRQQSMQHEVHKAMLTMLTRLTTGDAAWAANREAAYQEAKKLPLHALLTYLVHPEQAEAYDKTFQILSELSDVERDQLKVMVYRALLVGVQAGSAAQLQRRGNETLLMPHMVDKDVNYYWRTQVGSLQGTLFSALFDTIEAEAKQQTAAEGNLGWAARKAMGGLSAEQKIQQRKQREEALFNEALTGIVDQAIAQTEARQYASPVTAAKVDTVVAEQVTISSQGTAVVAEVQAVQQDEDFTALLSRGTLDFNALVEAEKAKNNRLLDSFVMVSNDLESSFVILDDSLAESAAVA